MKKILIRTKLLILISASIIGFILFGSITHFNVGRIKVNGEMYFKIIEGKDIVADILPPPAYIIETYLQTYEMLNSHNQSELRQRIQYFEKLKMEYYVRHNFWQTTLSESTIKTLMVETSYLPAHAYFNKIDSVVIPLLMANEYEKARRIIERDLKPLYQQHRLAIDELVILANKQNQALESDAKAALYYFYLQIILLSGIIVITILGVSFYIFKSITVPIKKGLQYAEEIAGRNLTVQLNLKTQDEIGRLSHSLQAIVLRLKPIIAETKQSAESILASSSEISSTSQQMANAANEQAASVEQVSASMTEMLTSIQENQNNAGQTELLANQAVSGILEEKHAITSNIAALRQIANKVQIINDIASKTDMLAINAAIEASRAGEQGRGFAIVAAEVRKLADLTQKAAKEINEISKTSLRAAENSGKAFEQVAAMIQNTNLLIQQIAAESIEQTNSTSQINSAIEQLNNLAQHNASASEELAANAEELTQRAQNLKSQISFFKTEISDYSPKANK